MKSKEHQPDLSLYSNLIEATRTEHAVPDQDDDKAGEHHQIVKDIPKLKKPLIVLIGGVTGVGKTSIASEVSKRLGIDRVNNSDVIREIMRYMLPKEIVPTLHESSFTAGSEVKNPFIQKNVIYGFSQQSSLVSQGVLAYIRRNVKEGLNTVMNGVHLIPGYLDLGYSNGNVFLFEYVLHLEDKETHIQRFYERSKGSKRDPEYYIRDIDAIRKIQTYIVDQANKHGTKVIENTDFEHTVSTIIKDITLYLEKILQSDQQKQMS